MSDLEALQRALAAEHAAVWAYGVVGGRLRPAARPAARAALDAHRARRDRLDDLIRAAGGQPVAALASYALPRPVAAPTEAAALAVLVEERSAAVYADAVATGSATVRSLAAAALRESAVRAALWRGASVPFPGLPERSR